MVCPVCRKPMIVLELDEVEIDHCIICGGIWLDSGELEILLESVKERETVLGSFNKDIKTKERKIKCPICLKRMDKVSCGIDKKVVIDKCRKNDGLWFNRGELREIIEMASAGVNHKVIDILKDMFSYKDNNF